MKPFITSTGVKFRNSFPSTAMQPTNCSHIKAMYPVPSTAGREKDHHHPSQLEKPYPHLPISHHWQHWHCGNRIGLAQTRGFHPGGELYQGEGLQGPFRDSCLFQLPPLQSWPELGIAQRQWFWSFSVILGGNCELLSHVTFTVKVKQNVVPLVNPEEIGHHISKTEKGSESIWISMCILFPVLTSILKPGNSLILLCSFPPLN